MLSGGGGALGSGESARAYRRYNIAHFDLRTGTASSLE